MGAEYIVRIHESELKEFDLHHQKVKSFHDLLIVAPGYISDDKSTYAYSNVEGNNPDLWPSSIRIDHCDLLLCFYSSEDYEAITQYLFKNFLDIFGRFEIMDA